jgi:hypothetical protein
MNVGFKMSFKSAESDGIRRYEHTVNMRIAKGYCIEYIASSIGKKVVKILG